MPFCSRVVTSSNSRLRRAVLVGLVLLFGVGCAPRTPGGPATPAGATPSRATTNSASADSAALADDADAAWARLVDEFRQRAERRNSDEKAGFRLTVSDRRADGELASTQRDIVVRRAPVGASTDDAPQAVEQLEFKFVRDGGGWRCREATSVESVGDKPSSQNRLAGDDIRLDNLFRWARL